MSEKAKSGAKTTTKQKVAKKKVVTKKKAPAKKDTTAKKKEVDPKIAAEKAAQKAAAAEAKKKAAEKAKKQAAADKKIDEGRDAVLAGLILKQGGKVVNDNPVSDNYAVTARAGVTIVNPVAMIKRLHEAFPRCVFTYCAKL